LYDPALFGFAPTDDVTLPAGSSLLAGSLPADGATDAPATGPIALRFSDLLQVASVNPTTVALSSATTRVPAAVVVAEAGRLAFVVPRLALTEGETYRVDVRGVQTVAGQRPPDAAISFTVARQPATDISARADDVDAGGINSPWRSLKPLEAGPGTTAVAGQVLQLSGTPLADVTLTIAPHHTHTDRTGRFLLVGPTLSGHQELVIDGRSASTPGRAFGVFEAGIDVKAGQTNALSFTSWMPRIDTAHGVAIASPTTSEAVLTTPAIPGLELHIPAGTVIKDIDGAPVNEVSITPIPLDRPPFPLPNDVYVPIYFTVQPGGGYLYANDDQ